MTQPQNLPPLFIGRFQPFHLGHLDAISQILAKHKSVIIGIGSAQYSKTSQNPFPAEMREQMIRESLNTAEIAVKKFTIVKIPDIHNDNEWVSHVESLCPPFGDVYSGTPKVQELFKKNAKHIVQQPKFNIFVSATLIREKIGRGEKWEELVPPAVAKIIKNNKFYGN